MNWQVAYRWVRPPDKGYKGLTVRSFNKHNTTDPFTNLLLCSLFVCYKLSMV
jgi:hypothetical protein